MKEIEILEMKARGFEKRQEILPRSAGFRLQFNLAQSLKIMQEGRIQEKKASLVKKADNQFRNILYTGFQLAIG